MDSDSDLRLTIARVARRMRHERVNPDLSDGQTAVLFSLDVHGARTLSELSSHEGVTAPSMNRTVNSLELAGLLVRNASPDDGRKMLITLTDAGRELVHETRHRREAWFADRLSALSPEERAALDAAAPVLRKLAEK